MKYQIGTIVILNGDITVYITEYDEKNEKYKGFDVDNNSGAEIEFLESDVMLTV